MAVEGDDEAVDIVNECRCGLPAAIYPQQHFRALRLAQKLKVGAIHINGSTVHGESTLPHGTESVAGEGSGLGVDFLNLCGARLS